MIIPTENQCPIFIYQLKSLQTGKTYNDKHRQPWKRESLDMQVWMHNLTKAKAQLWVAAPQEKMINPEKQLIVMLTSNTSGENTGQSNNKSMHAYHM
jgi:hypothetical protein